MSERENNQDQQMLAEYQYAKSQGFTDWLYKNVPIGNGDMLIQALENTNLQSQYLRDIGLPQDTELEY